MCFLLTILYPFFVSDFLFTLVLGENLKISNESAPALPRALAGICVPLTHGQVARWPQAVHSGASQASRLLRASQASHLASAYLSRGTQELGSRAVSGHAACSVQLIDNILQVSN